MRRRKGALIRIEADILDAALRIQRAGDGGFHGFALAKTLAGEGTTLTAHGTLYKALGRLEKSGLLESEWEDASTAEEQGRPRRRLYKLTGAGQLALAAHRAETSRTAPATRPAWESL